MIVHCSWISNNRIRVVINQITALYEGSYGTQPLGNICIINQAKLQVNLCLVPEELLFDALTYPVISTLHIYSWEYHQRAACGALELGSNLNLSLNIDSGSNAPKPATNFAYQYRC